MQKGDFVRINYTGRLESGEIFDLTDEELAKREKIHLKNIKYGPVAVIVGAGFVIPGLDKALQEMAVGDKRMVVIEPKDGFGERDARLIKVVPQSTFKNQNVDVKQGMVVDFSGTKGRIQSVSGGRVCVDFNNPLAGKTLKYELEIVEKIDDNAEKIKGILAFFGFFDADARIHDKEAVITASIRHDLKKKLSSIILDNIKEIEKVTYQESYQRNASKAEQEGKPLD